MSNHLARYCGTQMHLQLTPRVEKPKVIKDRLSEIIDKKPPIKIVREYIRGLVAEATS